MIPTSRDAIRVLVIVDDSQLVRECVQHGLQEMGWKVIALDSEFGVLRKIVAADPSIVLMDLNMPLLDGMSLVRCLRRDLKQSSYPIVLYSDAPTKVLEEACLKAGADGYLAKTDNMRYLDFLLRGLLSRSGDSVPVKTRAAGGC